MVERKVSSAHNLDLPAMNKTRELRLAKRMARLGTETAFEVLVKARALEIGRASCRERVYACV